MVGKRRVLSDEEFDRQFDELEEHFARLGRLIGVLLEHIDPKAEDEVIDIVKEIMGEIKGIPKEEVDLEALFGSEE